MTPTFVLSPLDAMLAHSIARQVHFPTFAMDAGLLCRICGTVWVTGEAWAADTGVCPGYQQCGLEPVQGAAAESDALAMVAACARHQQGDCAYVPWQLMPEMPDSLRILPPIDHGIAGAYLLPPVQTRPEGA